jgi:sugar lactone lactonase YvrE
MALDPEGRLYVSSRFEGTVYRVSPDGAFETFATDLGIACGLAFDREGILYVGDRSGTLFRVSQSGKTQPLAALPSSIAAFHLAIAPDGSVWVTAPTLSTYDPIYKVGPDGSVTTVDVKFGRPQGIAFDAHGHPFVVEALAGSSGLYRLQSSGPPELVLAGANLIGVAFDSFGTTVVCSNETAYRLK